MARRRQAQKRKVLPDPLYKSVVISKFINSLMLDGKKSKAEAIFYNALKMCKEKLNDEPVEIFNKALDNVKPVLEVKSRRVGGATYQVPVEVRPERRASLAIRWLISAARSRSGRSMTDKLANEFMDAYNSTGAAVRKREEIHRMAEGNKAFAHYRW